MLADDREIWTVPLRPYHLECTLCDQTWEGHDLTKLSRGIAWHWNRDHNGELYDMPEIDTVERDGHQTVGNRWTVERIPIHVTVFDVLEDGLGAEDGWATVGDTETVCPDCLRETPADLRTVVDTSGYRDEWKCTVCLEEEILTRRQENNRSLSEFSEAPSAD